MTEVKADFNNFSPSPEVLSLARAVMASLWKVSDGGTQVLMNVFYNALQQGYSKTEALQIAQQALITKNTSIVKSQRSPDGTIVFVSSKIELPVNISNILDHPFPSPCRRGLGRGYSVPSPCRRGLGRGYSVPSVREG
ncbi:MAG: CHAT domain-containing protein [Limnoraphis sp. WC205]|nr:CHAT domain-containing protein [Limnoraphis sp. WC205]